MDLVNLPPPATSTHNSRQGSDDSDSDDDSPAAGLGSTSQQQANRKRKRRERACDHCRSRKVKCNGFEFEDRVCTLCRKSGLRCSYVMKSKKRNNPPRPSAVSSSSATKPEPSPAESSSSALRRGVKAVGVEGDEDESVAKSILLFDPSPLPSAGDLAPASSAAGPSRTQAPSRMYMGKSSSFAFIQAAFLLARSATGSAHPPRPEPASTRPAAAQPRFGSMPAWEAPGYAEKLAGADWFPPDDLALVLIDFFFRRLHPVLPLFREGTFRARFASRDYVTDAGFNNVCLLVFAVAASHGKGGSRCWAPMDPRDPTSPRHGQHSSGWIYYHQSARKPRPRLQPAGLYDLQLSVLASIFLVHSSNPTVSWTIVGEGLSFAKELGAHRAGVALHPDEVEADSLRRAFWCLFLLDSHGSTSTGRPFHAASGSYDAPLPAIEVDGVVDPDMVALSPIVKAAELLRKSVDTMYSIDSQTRSKAWVLQQMGTLTAETDIFQQNLPHELRWTASEADDRLFSHATTIQVFLNLAKMYATRAALPSPQAPKQPSISSTFSDVCVAAALRVSVLLEAQAPRSGSGLPLLSPSEQAASILAIALFGLSGAGLIADEPALEEGMRRCYRYAHSAQDYWMSATMRAGWINTLLTQRNASDPAAAVEPPAVPRPTDSASFVAGNPTAETLLALAQQSTPAEHGAYNGPSSSTTGVYPWQPPPEFRFDFNPSALLPFTIDGSAADLDFGFAWDFMNAASGFS